MSKIATRRHGPGLYEVTLDGVETGILIRKAGKPKWGHPQEWDVEVPGEDAYLFTGKSKDHALGVILTLASMLKPRARG